MKHIETGRKIQMVKEKDVYVAKVWVHVGDKKVKGTIVVDSGAAECVMPAEWFPEIETMPPKKGVTFAGADGSPLGNYGRKLIEFTPVSGFVGQA